MAYKKVEFDGNTIIDLTGDGVTSDTTKVASGLKYHGKDGNTYTGTYVAPSAGTEGSPWVTVSGSSVSPATDHRYVYAYPHVKNIGGVIPGTATINGTGQIIWSYDICSGTKTITRSGTTDVSDCMDAYVAAGSVSPTVSATISGDKVTITPSASNSAGYITTGSTTGSVKTITIPGGSAVPSVTVTKNKTTHIATITPVVTRSSGYISSGSSTATAVTVSASDLVSGTLTINSSGVSNVSNYAYAYVPTGTVSSATIIYDDIGGNPPKMTLNPRVNISSGYIPSETITGPTIYVNRSVHIPSTFTYDSNNQLHINPTDGCSYMYHAIVEKPEALTPTNIKSGVTINGVSGSPSVVDISDSTGLPYDYVEHKHMHFYSDGVSYDSDGYIADRRGSNRATGSTTTIQLFDGFDGVSHDTYSDTDSSSGNGLFKVKFDQTMGINGIPGQIYDYTYGAAVDGGTELEFKNKYVAEAIGLDSFKSKIKSGETLLGVTGTYTPPPTHVLTSITGDEFQNYYGVTQYAGPATINHQTGDYFYTLIGQGGQGSNYGFDCFINQVGPPGTPRAIRIYDGDPVSYTLVHEEVIENNPIFHVDPYVYVSSGIILNHVVIQYNVSLGSYGYINIYLMH